MVSRPGGGKGGNEEGGSVERWGGRNTLPVGEEGKMGGEVGEDEEGEEVGGECELGAIVGSLLLVGVFELSKESMQKLEGSFSSFVFNSL